jgi:hypothetical protein
MLPRGTLELNGGLQTLGCDGTLAGQCMLVNFESLAEEEDQGAALQALVGPQLKASPSSIFFMANIEYLDASGAAVLLALVGGPSLSFLSCSLSPCILLYSFFCQVFSIAYGTLLVLFVGFCPFSNSQVCN